MKRIPFAELQSTIASVLIRYGLAPERAAQSATLFAETTRDGVYTHGLNRLPRLLAMIQNGSVSPVGTLQKVAAHAAMERWDGNAGVGNLNAHGAMQRAMELASEYGLGCVALRNTNHWMRGGTYGWQAADNGYFAICWTNTNPNTPAWGTTAASMGNNPLVLAAPRMHSNAPADAPYRGGPHVVVDTAMSQFSYGQIDAHIARHEPLPVPGGYDAHGNLTTAPEAIRASYRALPIGFWKGSSLALTLDFFAAMLSGGKASYELSKDPLLETGLSQFFIAISPANVAHADEMTRIADHLIAALHAAPRVDAEKQPRYPGQQTLALREENNRLGVPVEEAVWEQIRAEAVAPQQ